MSSPQHSAFAPCCVQYSDLHSDAGGIVAVEHGDPVRHGWHVVQVGGVELRLDGVECGGVGVAIERVIHVGEGGGAGVFDADEQLLQICLQRRILFEFQLNKQQNQTERENTTPLAPRLLRHFRVSKKAVFKLCVA